MLPIPRCRRGSHSTRAPSSCTISRPTDDRESDRMTPACIDDFRELARRRLPRFLFDYIDGGSYAEVTMRRNVADLQRLPLRQRVMRDVSDVRLDTTLFGRPA